MLPNQTMAIEITEDTYPIALACLSPGFTQVPIERAIGCYLVINSFGIEKLKRGGKRALVLGNHWSDKETFRDSYAFIGPEISGQFTPVTSKK